MIQLSELLTKVAALMDEKERLTRELKDKTRELEDLEQLAVEQLRLSGLDLVRVAGKTWSTRETFYVSIPKANKDKVMEIIKQRYPEMVSVSTSTLKSWLQENRKAGSENLADGTPFAGLLSEHCEVRLAHLTVG